MKWPMSNKIYSSYDCLSNKAEPIKILPYYFPFFVILVVNINHYHGGENQNCTRYLVTSGASDGQCEWTVLCAGIIRCAIVIHFDIIPSGRKKIGSALIKSTPLVIDGGNKRS